jgi:hypothetical protein
VKSWTYGAISQLAFRRLFGGLHRCWLSWRLDLHYQALQTSWLGHKRKLLSSNASVN